MDNIKLMPEATIKDVKIFLMTSKSNPPVSMLMLPTGLFIREEYSIIVEPLLIMVLSLQVMMPLKIGLSETHGVLLGDLLDI